MRVVGNGVSGLFELVGNVETGIGYRPAFSGIVKCRSAPGSGRPDCELTQGTQALISDD
jgi:hypothetical protein